MQQSDELVPLQDILITPTLAQRPTRPADFAAEARALHLLAREMCHTPQHFLQCLVSVARELCHAGSAGISYLEHGPDGDCFRWVELDGALQHYRGRAIPRQVSPCGACLDRQTFELFAFPGRHYAEFRAVDPPVVEGLILPVYVEGRPLGTIWVTTHDDRHHFENEDLRLLRSLSDFAGMALEVQEARDTASRLNTQLRDANLREQALRQEAEAARDQVTRILENMSHGFSAFDREWRYTYLNAVTERLAGRPREELLGKVFWEEFPAARGTEIETALRRAVAEQVPVEFDAPYAAGNQWFAGRAYPLTDGGLCVFYEEIAARKQVEYALRASEEKYRKLFTAIDEGFCIIEKVEDEAGGPEDFRYVEANPAFAMQSGVSDVVGKTIRQAFPSEPEKWLAMYDAVLRTGEPIRLELELVTQGRMLDLYAFRVEDGTQRRVAVLFKDITKRKQAEEALARQAEELQRSNDELQQFAHVASHDLNAPLRTVVNFLQLLDRRYRGKLDATADEYIAVAVGGAKRMQTLLADLLVYTRVGGEAPTFTTIDCEAVLARVLGDLQQAIQESTANVTHDPLPIVTGDGTQLGLVFQNLVGNALKFRGAAPPCIHVSARLEGRQWVFSVRDNGIGIDPQYAERIFQVFQRLHSRQEYGGSGIGLAICKRIVERHGGRIWVESAPGSGATFSFTIAR